MTVYKVMMCDSKIHSKFHSTDGFSFSQQLALTGPKQGRVDMRHAGSRASAPSV